MNPADDRAGRARGLRIFFLSLLAGALAAGAPALAYIPAASVLLRKAAARVNEGSRTRDVSLTGTLQIGDAAPAQRVLALRFPLSCRFEGGAQARG